MTTAAELKVLIEGDSSGVQGALGSTEGMVSKLTGTLGKVGLASMGIGAITGVAGSAMGAVGGLISSAESLGDAQARTNIVFGDAASAVQASAEAQANALGMTREAYLAAAGATGDLATSLGVSKEKAAGMASGLTELAPKLAAYTGAETGAVSDAFEKALAGKTKGLQALGIAITDADVKQTAMSMHVQGEPKDWDSATKAQVMYQAIMEKTTGAQSAWADNSGDVEVSMQRLNAAMDDAKATIGEKLLPVIAPLVQQLADALPGAISTVVGWLNQAKPVFDGIVGFFKEHPQVGMLVAAIGGLAGVFGTVMAVVGPFMPIVGAIVSGFGALMGIVGPVAAAIGGIAALFNPVTIAIGLVVAAVVGLKLAWDNNLGGIQEKVASVVGWVQGAWSGFVGFLQENTETIKTILLAIVTGGLSLVVQGWQQHGDEIKAKAADIASGVQGKWDEMKAGVLAKAQEIRDNVSARWDETKAAVSDALSAIWSDLKLKWDSFLREITDKLQAILGAVTEKWEAVKAAIASAMDLVKTTLTEKWEAAKQAVSDALARIRETVDGVMGRVREIIDSAMGIVRQVISDVLSHVTTLWGAWRDFVAGVVEAFKRLISGDFAGAFETMKTTVQRGIDAVIGFFRGMGHSIRTAIGNAATLLFDIGRDIIGGLERGFRDAWDGFVAGIGGIVGPFADLIRKLLGGGHSPIPTFIPVGRDAALGVMVGFVDAWRGTVVPTVRRLVGDDLGIIPPFRSMGEPAPEPGGGRGFRGMGTPAGFPEGPDVPWQGLAQGVKVSAFRTGRGGLVAASKTNFWRVMVQKWGMPEESSARKMAAQLGIPIPDWLEQLWHPTADAKETGMSLTGPAGAAGAVTGATGALVAAVGEVVEAIQAGATAVRSTISPIAGGSIRMPYPVIPPEGPGIVVTPTPSPVPAPPIRPGPRPGPGPGEVVVNFRPTIRNVVQLGAKELGDALMMVLPEQTFRAITAPQGG